MALDRRRVNEVPEDVVQERTKVFKPLNCTHAGRLPGMSALTPGAVEATTLEPDGKASVSMRTNAL